MRKIWSMLLAALVVGVMSAGAVVSAQEAERPKADDVVEEKAEKDAEKEAEKEDGDITAEVRKGMKDIESVTGKVEYAEADVSAFLKHWTAFTDKFGQLDMGESSIKDTFDGLIKNDEYLAWAKERELNAEDYLRKSYRVLTNFLKLNFAKLVSETVKAQRDMVERMRDQFDDEDVNEMLKELDTFEADIKEADKLLQEVPGPTADEKKLLEKHDEALRTLLFGSDG